MDLLTYNFPDKGQRTLLEYTHYLLTTPEGRIFLKELVTNPSICIDLENDMNREGFTGTKDVITYYKEGIKTYEMSQVFKALKINKGLGIKDINLLEENENKSFYASLIGFLVGDVLGLSYYGVSNGSYTGNLLQWKKNIIPDNYNNVPLISYNSEMALSLLKNKNYNVNVALDEYIDIIISAKTEEKLILPILEELTFGINKEESKFKKYKSNFKKLFGTTWDKFFDNDVEGEIYAYGGCLGRVVPLALFGKAEYVVRDVWLTDPYPNAFQAVYFITSLLKMLYNGSSPSEIIKTEWNFGKSFSEVKNKKSGKLSAIKSNDIYVLSVHYSYLILRFDLDDVINLCKTEENSKSCHILFSVIMAIWCAKVGLHEIFKNKIMNSNVFKVYNNNAQVAKYFKKYNNYFN